MTSKALYIFFISAVLGLLVFLIWELWSESPYLFLAGEMGVLGLVWFAMDLYRRLFTPMEVMEHGIETLKAQDYNLRFKETGSDDVDNLIEVYNALIERLRTEKVSMIEQNLFLDKLIQRLPIGVVIMDYDNLIVDMNPEAKSLLKLDSIPLHKESHPLLKEIDLEKNDSSIIRIDGFRKLRVQVSSFMQQGFKRRFILLEDLTSEINQVEKNAYGKVIRMMSHEVNNSIGAINSILDTLSRMNPLDTSLAREYLGIVSERNDRLNGFMKNFANVVRIPPPTIKAYDVVSQMRNLSILYQTSLEDHRIKPVLDLPQKSWEIEADSDQIQQVLENALKNAIEASDSDSEIILRVSPDAGLIQIKNTGSKISDEVMEKIFTPFYSTKQDGQGIGLTVCKEVLQNHNFAFNLYQEGGWTVFEIAVS